MSKIIIMVTLLVAVHPMWGAFDLIKPVAVNQTGQPEWDAIGTGAADAAARKATRAIAQEHEGRWSNPSLPPATQYLDWQVRSNRSLAVQMPDPSEVPEVQCLVLGGSSSAVLDSSAFNTIARYPKLAEIAFNDIVIDAAALRLLSSCQTLRRLALRSSHVQATVASRLYVDHPIAYTEVLDAVGAITNLQTIVIEMPSAFAAGWVGIAQLRSLTELKATGLGDDAVSVITRGCSQLEVFDLSCPTAQLTDRCLPFLAKLSKLRRLDLSAASQIGWLSDLDLSKLSALECLNLDYSTQLESYGQYDRAGVGKFLDDSKPRRRTLTFLDGWKSLRWLSLAGVPLLEDEVAKHCRSLSSLEYLDISGCSSSSFSEEDCTAIGKLSRLRVLRADKAAAPVYVDELRRHKFEPPKTSCATDQLIKALAPLRQLEELSIADSECSGETLSALSEHTTLRKLGLRRTKISDAALSRICKLPQLVALDLAGCNALTAARLMVIKEASRLEDLCLTNCMFVDDGLVTRIISIPSIRVLILCSCPVTSAAWRNEEHSVLITLDLRDTKCSRAESEELRRRYPACKVIW